MKFVKVPGTKVLFCIHETRNKDFSAYVAEHPGITLEGEEDEPVKLLKATDARLFCGWLTKKEGRNYRLPTAKEWDAAVGLRRSDDPDEFPWGRKWPPPKAAANLSPQLKDYADDFPRVAPVMCFTPNKLGIYDLSGNMWEVCEATTDASAKECLLRGGSWTDYEDGRLRSSFRMTRPVDAALSNNTGFRIVLETTE